MRIGIDATTILFPARGEMAGVGHYTYFLIKNLLACDTKNEYVLFFDDAHKAEVVGKMFQDTKNVSIRIFPLGRYKKYLPFFYAHIVVAFILYRATLDVYHAPANVIPLGYRGRSVVTVHDLAIYQHPEWFPQNVWQRAFSTHVLVPRSMKKATRVIAVSEATKKDIVSLLKTDTNKVSVVYEGCEEGGARFGADKQGKYAFFVGTIEPRKNLERLIRAFVIALTRMRENGNKEDMRLMIAGARGWKCDGVFEAMKLANEALQKQWGGGKEYVRYLGYITPDEKWRLMNEARVFVFPSLYEGFGLPVLEAMAMGTPVITSRVSSLPEIGGDAVMYVDPNDEQSIARAMELLLSSEVKRKELSERGREQAKKFSWETMARETVRVYEEIGK